MVPDNVERGAQLLEHDGLRFDAVALLEPGIAHLNRHNRGRAIVLGQDRWSTFVPTE